MFLFEVRYILVGLVVLFWTGWLNLMFRWIEGIRKTLFGE